MSYFTLDCGEKDRNMMQNTKISKRFKVSEQQIEERKAAIFLSVYSHPG